jgi:hypothetical protein
MTFYEFALASPWLTFFLAYVIGYTLVEIVKTIVTGRIANKDLK